MRALKLTFLLSLLPTLVFAGNIDMSGNGEDCALTRALTAGLSGVPRALCAQAVERYKQGRQTQENVTTICRGTQNVAWFQDRDNSMSEARNIVGQSMVVIFSKNNNTIGIQPYCPKNPGTVLGAGHGIVDDPRTAREQNRDYRSPAENLWGVSEFPVGSGDNTEVSNDSQVISPLTDVNADRNDPALDYAFIVPDKRLNSESDGIKILNTSEDEIVSAVNNNQVDLHLYRAQTTFAPNNDGSPNFDSSPTRSREARDVYTGPLRVNQECRVNNAATFNGLTSTDCPIETGVSGSPMVSEIEGEFYISGIATKAISANFDEFNERSVAGSFLNSDKFCSDYEKVCGVSCSSLETVLPNSTTESQGVSL